MLVCGSQDGANQDLMLGSASYTFLLNAMKKNQDMKNFVEQKGLVVTSDRYKGVENAVNTILGETAHHRYCALHHWEI